MMILDGVEEGWIREDCEYGGWWRLDECFIRDKI